MERHPNIKTIYLHLDNDDAGRIASKAIEEQLKGRYIVIDDSPPVYKDCNDYLMQYRRHQRRRLQEKILCQGQSTYLQLRSHIHRKGSNIIGK